MNSTSAADVIIQPLWPGPDPAIFDDTVASAASAPRAPLLTYASRSATRCSRLGSALSPPCAAALLAPAATSVAARITAPMSAQNVRALVDPALGPVRSKSV